MKLPSLGTVANLASLLACILVGIVTIPMLGNRTQAARNRPGLEKVDLRTSLPSTTLNKGRRTKLALIEFSDFQCPFCAAYTKEVFPQLRKSYVDGGLLTYAFRHFPLGEMHPLARDAGKAAQCAGQQQQFWPMHDLLFTEQQSLSPADLLSKAARLGLDRERFDDCLAKAAPILDEDLAEGRKLGVVSTPTFFIGIIERESSIHITGKIRGSQPVEAFNTAIAEALRAS
jgi:protein-disulfide isomerase